MIILPRMSFSLSPHIPQSHHNVLTLMPSDGTCVRDYLHVMDLAKGHVLSLDALDKKVSEGIFKTTDTSKSGYYRAFNLGKGKGMSVLDMINAMKKASGFDFQYEIVGRRYVILSSSSSLPPFPLPPPLFLIDTFTDTANGQGIIADNIDSEMSPT